MPACHSLTLHESLTKGGLRMFRFSLERIFQIPTLNTETGIVASIGAIVGPIINHFYGDGRMNFVTLLFLIIIADWITGTVASHKDGTYASEYGIEGILRTLVILMIPSIAHFLDNILNTPGFLFYGVIFGLMYHILQSMTANVVRAKWDRWIPRYVLNLVSSEVKAKENRAKKRKEIIEDSVSGETAMKNEKNSEK